MSSPHETTTTCLYDIYRATKRGNIVQEWTERYLEAWWEKFGAHAQDCGVMLQHLLLFKRLRKLDPPRSQVLDNQEANFSDTVAHRCLTNCQTKILTHCTEVEKHPILYNCKLPEYSRKDLTADAWNEVGKVVKLTGSECKEKWKNLRAVFVRNMKSTQSGIGGKKKKPYYLAGAMLFTLPFIKAVTSTTPEIVLEALKDEQDVPDLYEDEEEDSDLQSPSLAPPFQNLEHSIQNEQLPQQLQSESSPGKSSARNQKRANSEVVDNCFVKYFNAKKATLATSSSDKSNSTKMFLLSLLPELDEMTDQQMKIFKRKVLHLIDDIMLMAPDTSTQSMYSSASLVSLDSQTTPSSLGHPVAL
uniref:MADF domain-containing protein n=1 Tax=Timema poppense TaxID=170557 RepID=A0A7R9H9N7_TIMPO|nr:unnamed protein product [Timema poppensis]